MRKFLLIIFILLFCSSAYCEESEKSTQQGYWGDSTQVFDKTFENQKQVTDTQFEKTIKMLKERSASKKQKKLRKEIFPNAPAASEEAFEEFVDSMASSDDLTHTLTVQIPVLAYTDNGNQLYPGYYKLSCQKDNYNQYFLILSQGTNKVAKIHAMHTDEDFDQDTIEFCNAKIQDNKTIKLIYGGLDLNLVGYIYY